jgi:transcriptional regulator with XRE-family HTH domain
MPRLFGNKLRYLRQQHGIFQADLAHQLGLASHAHIANLEASKDAPSLDLIVRVVRLFSVTADSLLRDTIPIEELAAHRLLSANTSELSTQYFGTQLRVLRLQRNLSQVDLARQLGIARQGYISNLEAGRKRPSPELIVQTADLFGVTTDDLLQPSEL